MKILHLLNSTVYTGAENVVCQIIKMFRNEPEFEMTYCSPAGQVQDSLEQNNIPYLLVKKLTITEIKSVIKKEHPDIIHAHDSRASILSLISCGNIPVISHLHNNFPWIRKYGIYSFIYGVTCIKYRSILTVSGSVFDEYVFGNKFMDKLTVIGNPVNVREIRTKTNLTDNKKKYDIGFCGRFSPQKNIEGFIDIVERLGKKVPDISAAMIGDGEQFEEMKELIRKKNLNHVITLYGYQNNPYNFMKTFKILCMPSRWEGFGLVAVEALVLGVPVVCSNVGGLPGIVNDDCGKICDNEDEMFTACLELLSNAELLEKKANGALNRANELDNTECYKSTLMKVYKSSVVS